MARLILILNLKKTVKMHDLGGPENIGNRSSRFSRRFFEAHCDNVEDQEDNRNNGHD